MAFEIGAVHRARGAKPLRPIDLWRRYRAQQKLIRGYPKRLSDVTPVPLKTPDRP